MAWLIESLRTISTRFPPRFPWARTGAAACLLAVGHLGAHAAGSFKWGNVVMGGGGFVSGIIASKTEKNLIYARTDVGGAYRWNEAAQGWIPITDWLGPNDMGLLGIDGLALDPSAPGRVYMLAGTDYWNQGKTMILRSADYGETFDTINVTAQFKTHGNGYGRQNGERLAVDPNQPTALLCGTRSNGLWKSEDRGSTWSQVASFTKPASGDGIGFVLFDKTRVAGGATQRILVGTLNTGSNLFISDDAGKTWQAIALPTLSKQVMPQRAVLTPKGRYLYVTVANGSGPGFGTNSTISRGAILRYDTDSKSWENISPENSLDDPADPAHPGQTLWDAHLGGYGGLSMDASDSNHIIAASINSWKPQIWEQSGKAAWGDKMFTTADGGKTWKSLFGDLTDAQIGSVTNASPIAVLGKNGYGWIEGESIHWAGSLEFDPFDSKRVFATSGNGIYMTANLSPGQRFNWNFSSRGLEETVPFDVASIPGGPLITVIGDYDGFVHRDINSPPQARHKPSIGTTTGLDFAKQKTNIVVRVGGNDKAADHAEYVFPLYYSTDTGKTWTKFATHPGTRPESKRQARDQRGRIRGAMESRGQKRHVPHGRLGRDLDDELRSHRHEHAPGCRSGQSRRLICLQQRVAKKRRQGRQLRQGGQPQFLFHHRSAGYSGRGGPCMGDRIRL